MKVLVVKDFDKHQHYKNRRPPWIKLYNAVLEDYAFLSLSDSTRGHLMLLWLLASRHDNQIPFDAKYIARAIQSTAKIDFDALIASGLVSVLDLSANKNGKHSDSGALASRKQSALLEGEGEGEKEREKEGETEKSPPPPPARDALADRLVAAGDVVALDTLLSAVPNPAAWCAEMSASLEGMHGPPLSAAQLGTAIRDYVGNGALKSPGMQHFRRYMQRAREPEKPAAAHQRTGRRNAGEETYENSLVALKDFP